MVSDNARFSLVTVTLRAQSTKQINKRQINVCLIFSLSLSEFHG